MVDDCTSYWLERNRFSFQYEIEELGLEVYKNNQSIVTIDSKSVMKSMYPVEHFIENGLDERTTIINNHLEGLKNVVRKSAERFEPEKKKKKKEDTKILKEIQNHNERLEVLWDKIVKKNQ